MRKIFTLVIAVAVSFGVTNAQTVGIGTTSPNPNAVLDISSVNKGVLLPRIGDTATVPTPSEGLIIYNKNTKSPYFYNGSRWVSLGTLPSTTSVQTDRITYKVTGTGFTTTEEPVFAISQGISKAYTGTVGSGGSAAATSFQDFGFTKAMDINSAKFNEVVVKGMQLVDIEFRFYAAGAANPYVSYKFRDVVLTSYSVSGAEGGGPINENISIVYAKYGFKDWINSKEFGWNLATNMQIPY